MKIQVIQNEYQGIPQTPELFFDEEKALQHFEGKVEALGYRPKWKNEAVQRYLQRFNDWFADNHEKGDPVRWWEVDLLKECIREFCENNNIQ